MTQYFASAGLLAQFDAIAKLTDLPARQFADVARHTAVSAATVAKAQQLVTEAWRPHHAQMEQSMAALRTHAASQASAAATRQITQRLQAQLNQAATFKQLAFAPAFKQLNLAPIFKALQPSLKFNLPMPNLVAPAVLEAMQPLLAKQVIDLNQFNGVFAAWNNRFGRDWAKLIHGLTEPEIDLDEPDMPRDVVDECLRDLPLSPEQKRSLVPYLWTVLIVSMTAAIVTAGVIDDQVGVKLGQTSGPVSIMVVLLMLAWKQQDK